jgi:probable addiction module antidote protein
VKTKETDRLEILKRLRDAAQRMGMPKLAKKAGINPSHIYSILSDDGNPTITSILKIAKALGMQWQVTSVIEDQLDVAEARKALKESRKRGTIPLSKVKADLKLK